MLSITDISVRIAGRLLIDHGTVQIVPGARVGLIGRNGVGKSTLFQAIRGELPLESGSITLPPRWRIGTLAQEAPNGPESLLEVVWDTAMNQSQRFTRPGASILPITAMIASISLLSFAMPTSRKVKTKAITSTFTSQLIRLNTSGRYSENGWSVCTQASAAAMTP